MGKAAGAGGMHASTHARLIAIPTTIGSNPKAMAVMRRVFAWILTGALILSAAATVARAEPACESPAKMDSASAGDCASCGDAGEKGSGSPGCPIVACTAACLAGSATPAAALFIAEPLSYGVELIMADLLERPARRSAPEPPPPR